MSQEPTLSPSHPPNDELRNLKERLNSISLLKQVAEIAVYVLDKNESNTKDKKKSAVDIWEGFKALQLPFEIEKETFYAYLSRVVKEAEYPIASTGRGRGGGYYLSDTARGVADKIAQPAENAEEQEKGEKVLYPFIRQWLIGQGYQAQTTARRRGLGKWANPDVTGVKVTEHLGTLELELVTIEVKTSLAQWEYWFFEAVAHRRYANRAFFAFPMGEELSEKAPGQLRYMCELYRVGALILIMEDERYRELQDEKLNGKLTPDDVYVQELHGAPWSRVPLEH
jgi:hypothetical protein